MKKLLGFLGLLLLVVLFVGCGSSAVEGISVTSENNVRTIKVGETLQLNAKVFPENAEQSVAWSSSKEEVATVDSNGLVTAVSVGNVDIIATSEANKDVKQSFTIIIEEGEEGIINPESITINAVDNVTTCQVGQKIELYVTVYPVEANQAVTWESSDETIATVSRGEVTALKEGSVTITAKARGLESVSASITLTFTPSDDPVVTKDWPNMAYTTHSAYMEAENDTPLKVKGVVTNVSPVDENTVTYLIQNGKDGYYVYAQNSTTFPVELGKVYEVGGFKKYYRGLNEIVNVEYFKELDENITYTVNTLDGIDTTSLDAVSPLHCSFVTGKATFKSGAASDSKAYSFYAYVNGYDTTFRVDPSYMSEEEFAEIYKVLSTAVVGGEFEFTGFMSAFGYGAASPQIMVVKASDLKFSELTNKDLLEAAGNVITVANSVSFAKNEITLPTTVSGFDGVTVAWESNSELINAETGVVTHGSENTKVTLTATLTLNGEEYKKTFEVLVFALDNTEYTVLASLDLEDAEAPNSYGNSASKSGYAEGTVNLGTPKATWLLRNALIAAATNDIYDGTMAIRAQAGKTKEETARIEIQQDGEYNVVEFATAVYGNDASGIQIIVEYSTDSGKTWTAASEVITVDSKTLETYRIKLPEGNKRVAIVVVENSGRRVNIDNIKLMK